MRKLLFTLGLLTIFLFGYSQTIYIPSGIDGIGTSTTGKIGIETSTPLGLLDIAKLPGQYQKPFVLSDGSGNLNVFFEYPSTGLNYLTMFMRDNNNTNKVCISPSENSYFYGGNVGIGTNSPSYKLQVHGSVLFKDASSVNGFYFADGIGANRYINIYDDSGSSTIKLSPEGNSYFNGGNFGIGTTNPASKFEVNGDISLARTHKIKFLETVSGNDRAYIRSTNGQNGEDFNSLIFAVNTGIESMIIKSNGNVGIGTTSPDYKLDVLGTIRAQEVKVDLEGADFVFEKDYDLRSLEELESFINENKHLPEIESAGEMEENGTELGELNSKLLQKIEELTLYMIEQNKKTENLIEKVETLESENKELKEKILKIEISE